jgi:hypothetical protein
VADELDRHRPAAISLALDRGHGRFLVIALAVPDAFAGEGRRTLEIGIGQARLAASAAALATIPLATELAATAQWGAIAAVVAVALVVERPPPMRPAEA